VLKDVIVQSTKEAASSQVSKQPLARLPGVLQLAKHRICTRVSKCLQSVSCILRMMTEHLKARQRISA